MAHFRFKRAYFDTNVLVADNWPHLSTNLTEYFWQSDILKVRNFVPDLVERELEARWLRAFKQKVEELNRKTSDINRHLLRPTVEAAVPSVEEAIANYRSIVQQIRQAHQIDSVPLPRTTNVAEFVRMAIERHPPFEREKEKGFQDAVILMSIVEHLQESPEPSILVSNDKIFGSPEIQDLLKARSMQLEVVRSIEEAGELLKKRLVHAVRKMTSASEEKVSNALLTMRGEINNFIAEKLEANQIWLSTDPYVPGTIKMISAAELADIERIAMASAPWEQKPGQRVEFSAEARVDLDLLVEVFPSTPSKPLRIGQPSVDLHLTALAEIVESGYSALSVLRRESLKVPKKIRIDGSAERTEDGYTNIYLLAVQPG